MDFGDFEGAEMLSGVLESLGFGVILLCLLAIPALYVVSALIFKLSCRIGGEEPPGLGRACAILFLQSIVGSAVGAAVNGVGMGLGIEQSVVAAIAVGGASSILSWMANAGILTSMMSYGFLRSMWIGFLHTLLVIVMIGGPIGAIVLGALLERSGAARDSAREQIAERPGCVGQRQGEDERGAHDRKWDPEPFPHQAEGGGAVEELAD